MGSRREKPTTSPWQRYVESAVRGPAAVPGPAGSTASAEGSAPHGGNRTAEGPAKQPRRRRGLDGAATFRHRVQEQWSGVWDSAWQGAGTDSLGNGASPGGEAPRRRTDVRLAVPAVAVWAACIAGLWLQPVVLGALCCGSAAAGMLLICRSRQLCPPGQRRGTAPGTERTSGRRSFLSTSAAALFLAAAAAAHSAAGASQRFEGPLAEAVAAGKSVVAVVEVAGNPRALTAPGHAGTPERWSIPVWTRDVSTGGVLLRTRAQLVVMGGGDWGTVVTGQLVRATGKLRPPEQGTEEAAILAASSGPGQATGVPILEGSAKELREQFVAASSFLAPDPRGLLPGMVTGDTTALDEGLETAMKEVGMTHLTAVSGANCSLVLGALLLACRSLRLPRLPAAALAGAGLWLFVLLVGPDASVLRAALMGAVAVMSLAGGRSGRGLSFLCLAVIGLLLMDPGLGSSFGFLLSVLATLGIIVLGRRIIDWTPGFVPRWAAAAVAVPLSAQLLCGPVIVLLQPQFSTYSLLANVIASPLVAPVTLLGTAAVPLVVPAPWPATALIAVAGTFSSGVAATARFTSQLPGASLPWPEGIPGLLTMLFLSVLTYGTVWAIARPRQAGGLVLSCHGRLVSLIEVMETRSVRALRRHAFRPEPGAKRTPVWPPGPGLEQGAGRGRLGYSTHLSGRNPRWPLRRSEQPVPRHRMQPPGGT
ncbi:ComEC/Rec2 family competence protein [Pseudarthrobacter scleromae]|uniref:ComEC/Rec2 family competence protein n=1 Tax=Pseudarthrobacter scleromae TaxID=158897 RepID=UPI00166E8384|nr:ComEC/Rec2 family competence protein [Pseudarthrobacter scleromae]